MPANDLTGLLATFKALPGKLDKNLRVAVRMAADAAANEARQNHDYEDRSSVLTNSIEPDGPSGSFAGGDLSATVSAGAPYALWVEKGTKPHVIKPKHRKWLRFPIEGGFRFAKQVQHPGTKPTLFLSNAVEKTMPKLTNEMIPDAVELSFLQAGFR
jgi:HK97 gp10 family phage protein